jgi:hypothetical protein
MFLATMGARSARPTFYQFDFAEEINVAASSIKLNGRT